MLVFVFLFAFSVSFAPLVTAPGGGACDISQTIMLLESTTNSHGEIWSGTTYTIPLCYDIIFGQQYTGANPQTCTNGDGNLVLKLSAPSNAHAEANNQNNYNTNVCYGDLVCTVESGACTQGTFVVAISGNTNAHLANSSQQGYLNVCCTQGGAQRPQCSDGIDNDGDQLVDFDGGGVGPPDPGCTDALDNDETDIVSGTIDNVEWHNGFGEVITESFVNNTVYLYSETTFNQGARVQFEVFEDDLLLDDPIRAGANALYADVNSQGIAVAEWTITDEDMARTADYGEFYFVASLGTESRESLRIPINNEEGSNSPPKANITAPRHRGIYFINQLVKFNESSKDRENRIVSYNWRIENQNGLVFESNERSFFFAFPSADQYIITLKVTDEKGLSGESQAGVIGIGNNGMLAYVNKPFHKQIVVNESLILSFSASDSYVINVSGGCPDVDIICMAGNCPARTENFPPACMDIVSLNGNLNQGFAALNFSWEFDDSQRFSGFGLVSGEKAYPLPSDEFDDKLIEFSLDYQNSVQNLLLNKRSERVFTLLDRRQCVDGGQTWIFLDENGFELERRSTLDSSACAGADGNVNTQQDNCCPSGFICTQDGCRTDETAPERCGDYLTEPTCEEDAYRIARFDPLWNELNCGRTINGSVISCACAWNQTARNETGACGLEKTSISGGGGSSLCTEYQCLYTYEEGECRNGRMTVLIEDFFTPGTCNPGRQEEYRTLCEAGAGERIIPCGRPTIELPFFTDIQLIAATGIIVLMYFALHFFRKGK